ncbi:MAG TPA: hypothetical protein DCY35_08085 [Prolixibacteraceae bacterium]|nr:hypothetical protein [Prolixibacteraceae bacterium]
MVQTDLHDKNTSKKLTNRLAYIYKPNKSQKCPLNSVPKNPSSIFGDQIVLSPSQQALATAVKYKLLILFTIWSFVQLIGQSKE